MHLGRLGLAAAGQVTRGACRGRAGALLRSPGPAGAVPPRKSLGRSGTAPVRGRCWQPAVPLQLSLNFANLPKAVCHSQNGNDSLRKDEKSVLAYL